ncbi:MAG: hypothetical protein PHV32_07415 [Eubacteriales bacterium]|nr:hypothetical protein [Methanocorpusculum sp.]MDD4494161.1 hypothetical protein [Eubacteriales bacterium]
MFKVIFEFLTEPLGLPIAWYWEYIILAAIGGIAYIIAYNTVGNMYRANFISGRTSGSFFHWLIRLFVFAIIWAVTYGVIWLVKLITANWQMILMVSGIAVGAIGLLALTVFVFKKVKNSKAVSKNA